MWSCLGRSQFYRLQAVRHSFSAITVAGAGYQHGPPRMDRHNQTTCCGNWAEPCKDRAHGVALKRDCRWLLLGVSYVSLGIVEDDDDDDDDDEEDEEEEEECQIRADKCWSDWHAYYGTYMYLYNDENELLWIRLKDWYKRWYKQPQNGCWRIQGCVSVCVWLFLWVVTIAMIIVLVGEAQWLYNDNHPVYWRSIKQTTSFEGRYGACYCVPFRECPPPKWSLFSMIC